MKFVSTTQAWGRWWDIFQGAQHEGHCQNCQSCNLRWDTRRHVYVQPVAWYYTDLYCMYCMLYMLFIMLRYRMTRNETEVLRYICRRTRSHCVTGLASMDFKITQWLLSLFFDLVASTSSAMTLGRLCLDVVAQQGPRSHSGHDRGTSSTSSYHVVQVMWSNIRGPQQEDHRMVRRLPGWDYVIVISRLFRHCYELRPDS